MKTLSSLQIGERYTLVRFGMMGFLHSISFELIDYQLEPFAQHPETESLVIRPRGKQKLAQIRILENDDLLVYRGWIEVDTEMYVSTEQSVTGFTCRKSLLTFANRRAENAR